jgi:hypothetical protein
MNTVIYDAFCLGADRAWDKSRKVMQLYGITTVVPGNQLGIWAGHLLVDVLGYDCSAYVRTNKRTRKQTIFIIKDPKTLPTLCVMHEIGHCKDPEASQPAGYSGDPHSGKGARYEKRADLYAIKWALKYPAQIAEALIRAFTEYLMDDSSDTSDSRWRAKLILRYLRKYHPFVMGK